MVKLESDEKSLNMDCLLLLSLQSFPRSFCPTLPLLMLRELDTIGNCHLYCLYPLDLEKRGLEPRPLPRPRPLFRLNCLQA